jgi:DNA-binding beta-propeller fold protein YncE
MNQPLCQLARRTVIAAIAAMAVLAPRVSSAVDETPPLVRVRTIALKGPVGGLDHLAIDAKRGRLFVANTSNDSLDVVDLKAGKLLKQVSGQGRIRGVDYSPDVDQIFAGCSTGGVCNIIDGDGYEPIKSVALGDDADNVRYNPRTKRIYVVHADTELSVIDARDYSLRSPIALTKDLGGFKLEKERPRMYLNAKQGQVVVIDTEKDEVIDKFSVAPAGANAAVGEGAIAVIHQLDPDHYESAATITTVKKARTSIFNLEDGCLYLAVPRLAERPDQENPEIWVYRARP